MMIENDVMMSVEHVNEAVEVEVNEVEPVVEEKVVEGSEVTEEALAEVVSAGEAIENAIMEQLSDVEIDVEVPTELKELIRLRDNARQAYKENERRFRDTLSEQMRVKEIENPDEEYVDELEKALKKYVSKMRKYLKRYLVAKGEIATIRAAEAEAKEEANVEVEAVDEQE